MTPQITFVFSQPKPSLIMGMHSGRYPPRVGNQEFDISRHQPDAQGQDITRNIMFSQQNLCLPNHGNTILMLAQITICYVIAVL